MSTTPQEDMFAPFAPWGDSYYGLCVQDGRVTKDPVDGRDWTEYHLDLRGDAWELEVCEHENTGTILYYGKIPSREFFMALMTNIKGAPPIDWTKV